MAYKSEFFQRVLDDVKKYSKRRDVTRAGLLELVMVHSISPERLHPNPDDEFTHEDVGPNESIIEAYRQTLRDCRDRGRSFFDEPILIQKMQMDGYLIINGHHRWAAATKEKASRVRVLIVNPRKAKVRGGRK